MQRTGGSVSKRPRMRKRTGDSDSEEQKTAGNKTRVSECAAELPFVVVGSKVVSWLCVINVSVPFMMGLFPDIIKHLVYSHRVRVPFLVDHSQPADLSLNHTVNMYLTSEQGISLGVWHTVPESQWKEALGKGLGMVPRFFGSWKSDHHLSPWQWRHKGSKSPCGSNKCFGDSTSEPTEVGLTTDTLYLYQWVKARSGSSLVFYWKFPGFEYFFLDTMAENNTIFPNNENLKRMRSPLLILHAEDDHIVHIHIAQQLYEIAQSAQNSENRVKMIPLARSHGYLHNGLYKNLHLPNIIG
ncbi:unnamed protein product [Coregonus sp. 'balchen']|nr:unnamed protein product [Coregonus sp. 'balchen']